MDLRNSAASHRGTNPIITRSIKPRRRERIIMTDDNIALHSRNIILRNTADSKRMPSFLLPQSNTSDRSEAILPQLTAPRP